MATDATVGRPFAQAGAKRRRLTAITAASSGAAMLDGDRARHAQDDLALEPSPPCRHGIERPRLCDRHNVARRCWRSCRHCRRRGRGRGVREVAERASGDAAEAVGPAPASVAIPRPPKEPEEGAKEGRRFSTSVFARQLVVGADQGRCPAREPTPPRHPARCARVDGRPLARGSWPGAAFLWRSGIAGLKRARVQ
jgi:hypothetical protein